MLPNPAKMLLTETLYHGCVAVQLYTLPHLWSYVLNFPCAPHAYITSCMHATYMSLQWQIGSCLVPGEANLGGGGGGGANLV